MIIDKKGNIIIGKIDGLDNMINENVPEDMIEYYKRNAMLSAIQQTLTPQEISFLLLDKKGMILESLFDIHKIKESKDYHSMEARTQTSIENINERLSKVVNWFNIKKGGIK